MKKQNGFTLVELIVVIIVLGILAAFAIPKYIDLATDARKSAIEGLKGSIIAAAELVHSVGITKNINCASSPVPINGDSVTVTATCWPTSTAGGIEAALSGTSGFTLTSGATSAVFTKDGATTPANCSATYYSGNHTTVIDTSGC